MSNVFRAYLSGLSFVSVSSESTCYVEDMRILGSSETLINNVMTCASRKDSRSGGITECMMDVYPSYGWVSEECLDCTTSVMQTEAGLHCLPECISHITSDDCTSCIPSVLADFASRCNQGITGPREASILQNGGADNACNATDISYMQSADHFVSNALGCLGNLADFQTCIYANIPRYADISLSCKTCAGEQTTTTSSGSSIEAEQCGALCMQQGVATEDCSVCSAGLIHAIDKTCLGNGIFGKSIFFAIAVVIFALVN